MATASVPKTTVASTSHLRDSGRDKVQDAKEGFLEVTGELNIKRLIKTSLLLMGKHSKTAAKIL